MMRRIITHSFVALLTCVLGLTSSALFNALSPLFTKAQRPITSVVSPSATLKPESATRPIACRCYKDADEPNTTVWASETQKMVLNGGVLDRKAISLPKPPYPPIARAAHASGKVVVQVTVDERGCVISARALSGHPLLQQAAVQAAHYACFAPNHLGGQPVKVRGIVTYNFVLP
jgi:TonB family protein